MDGPVGDNRLLPLCLLRYSEPSPAGQLTVSPAYFSLVKVITRFSQPALLRKKWLDERTGVQEWGGEANLEVERDAEGVEQRDFCP
jgi:hypothetical protein